MPPPCGRWGHDGSHANAGGQLAVAHALRADGFDASEDGTGRGTPIIPCDLTNGIAGGDVAGTLEHAQHKSNRGQGVIAFDTTQITSKTNRCKPQAGDTGHPLVAEGHAPALAFNVGSHKGWAPPSMSVSEESALTLDASNIQGTTTAWAVRRLTPTECELLQAFKPGHTAIMYRGKPAADGPRYKALGNSMAVNVMAWIGARIAAFEAVKRALNLDDRSEAA